MIYTEKRRIIKNEFTQQNFTYENLYDTRIRARVFSRRHFAV